MITLLNIIRIIYSHIIIYKYRNIGLDNYVINKVIESHNTSNLNSYEAIIWINYLKQIGKCSKWNKSQMFREWLYHKNLCKHNLFTTHTDYVDYEENQNLKTYILRIIGNCIY